MCLQSCLLGKGQGGGDFVKPILEINADHAIVKKLEGSVSEDFIKNVSEVLLDQALLVSGAELKDPADFVKSLNSLLAE